MARPAKSAGSGTGVITKEEMAIRRDAEKKLKGDSSKLRAPSYLSSPQKKIFKYIVDNLKDSGILGNLDIYVLAMGAVTIDKIIDIDTTLNLVESSEDPVMYKNLITARSILAKDFFRVCNELSLSPQARAKLSISAVKAVKENKNPLLQALEDL